jgi:hypothetical protein
MASRAVSAGVAGQIYTSDCGTTTGSHMGEHTSRQAILLHFRRENFTYESVLGKYYGGVETAWSWE